MAFQDFLAGGFYGKIGDLVGQRWRNKRVVKAAYSPSNPRTEKQVSQRKKFKRALYLCQLANAVDWDCPLFDESELSRYSLRMSAAIKLQIDGATGLDLIPLIPYKATPPCVVTAVTICMDYDSEKYYAALEGTLPTADTELAMIIDGGSESPTVDDTPYFFCPYDAANNVLTIPDDMQDLIFEGITVRLCSRSEYADETDYLCSDALVVSWNVKEKVVISSDSLAWSLSENVFTLKVADVSDSSISGTVAASVQSTFLWHGIEATSGDFSAYSDDGGIKFDVALPHSYPSRGLYSLFTSVCSAVVSSLSLSSDAYYFVLEAASVSGVDQSLAIDPDLVSEASASYSSSALDSSVDWGEAQVLATRSETALTNRYFGTGAGGENTTFTMTLGIDSSGALYHRDGGSFRAPCFTSDCKQNFSQAAFSVNGVAITLSAASYSISNPLVYSDVGKAFFQNAGGTNSDFVTSLVAMVAGSLSATLSNYSFSAYVTAATSVSASSWASVSFVGYGSSDSYKVVCSPAYSDTFKESLAWYIGDSITTVFARSSSSVSVTLAIAYGGETYYYVFSDTSSTFANVVDVDKLAYTLTSSDLSLTQTAATKTLRVLSLSDSSISGTVTLKVTSTFAFATTQTQTLTLTLANSGTAQTVSFATSNSNSQDSLSSWITASNSVTVTAISLSSDVYEFSLGTATVAGVDKTCSTAVALSTVDLSGYSVALRNAQIAWDSLPSSVSKSVSVLSNKYLCYASSTPSQAVTLYGSVSGGAFVLKDDASEPFAMFSSWCKVAAFSFTYTANGITRTFSLSAAAAYTNSVKGTKLDALIKNSEVVSSLSSLSSFDKSNAYFGREWDGEEYSAGSVYLYTNLLYYAGQGITLANSKSTMYDASVKITLDNLDSLVSANVSVDGWSAWYEADASNSSQLDIVSDAVELTQDEGDWDEGLEVAISIANDGSADGLVKLFPVANSAYYWYQSVGTGKYLAVGTEPQDL